MTVPAVAVLRNLNHGQRNNPTGEQLVAAFLGAGAVHARTVGANGTLAFTATDPHRCIERAVAQLSASSPWRDVGFAFPVGRLAELLPAAAATDARTEFSAFAPGEHSSAPINGRRCIVIAIGDGWAVTVNEHDGESRATPTLERVLGRRVTSRAMATMRRAISSLP